MANYDYFDPNQAGLRQRVADSKRIVIKVGTSSIMVDNQTIDFQQIDRLAYTLTALKNLGKEVILVSSGAIGVGAALLGLPERPADIPSQQALASFGQGELIATYSRFFNYYNQKTAQILLTYDVIEFPESRKNATNAINRLLETGIIPIINENDAVAVEELDHNTKFGDNDTMSAVVMNLVDADLDIILSDVDGFYDKNPMIHPEAKLITRVYNIDEEIYKKAGVNITKFSTGGMFTKLQAAEIALENNKQMIIYDTNKLDHLFDIVKGEPLGTYFAKA